MALVEISVENTRRKIMIDPSKVLAFGIKTAGNYHYITVSFKKGFTQDFIGTDDFNVICKFYDKCKELFV